MELADEYHNHSTPKYEASSVTTCSDNTATASLNSQPVILNKRIWKIGVPMILDLHYYVYMEDSNT